MSTLSSPRSRESTTIAEGYGPGWPLRPVVGFSHPSDVLKDPFLEPEEKRAVLASWACDANTVPSRPTLRQLPTLDYAVPVSEILAALHRLDS